MISCKELQLHYITLYYIIVIWQTLLSRATYIEVYKQNRTEVYEQNRTEPGIRPTKREADHSINARRTVAYCEMWYRGS